VIGLVAAASLMGASFDLPSLPPIRRDPQVTYLDRTGAVLGVRGGRYPPPVDIDTLPSYVPAAFVAIEDRRFYEHAGFDPVGIARAIVSDLGHGGAREGASTITQQLARNLFLGSERTLERKGEELLLAVELEQKFTKKQILGLYLSRVYFGSGAYGIDAAAHRFFDKPASRLTVREAAMLAAVMKSPTNYNPIEQPDASAQRAALVLDAMADTGAITEAVKARALAQRPKVWRDDPGGPAAYFIDWVDAQVRGRIGAARQDLIVDTTLDEVMERAAGDQARAVVARRAAQGVQQAALVALDGAGHVRAMVGGVDYARAPYNRAVEAHRQAGSSWKPFVYLAAMEAGRTPDTLAVDEPVTIDGWSPRDFEDEFLGQITLSQALAHSINTIAARLADEVGREQVAGAARRLGVVSPINTEPAMALGTTLVTPLEMAQAYDAFANGGSRATAYGLVRIRTAAGAVLFQHQDQPQPAVIANPPLGEMNAMLRGVLAYGTGVKAAIPGYDLAGKTGTTSDFKDAWFCGFTGNFTTVVWMGRDDATPMHAVTGGGAPAEMWRGFMSVALKRFANRPIPAGPLPPPPPPAPDIATPAPPTDAVAPPPVQDDTPPATPG
jgi:penicillin-binding protein 1A